MKKIILIIAALVLISHYGFAQQTVNNVDPAKDVNIPLSDQFTGKWEWIANNKSLTLILSRNGSGFDSYFLHGWFSYIVNGKVIINQLDKLDSIKYAGLTGAVLKGNDTLHFSFSDITRDRIRRGTINFINNDHNKILIRLNEKYNKPEHHLDFGPKRPEYTEKLPENLNIILTRVK